MNLYRAWDFPLRHLIIANLTPFTKVYRPAGGAFYRILFAIFGLHPMPYRIAIYCFLLLNIALTYWLVKLLTDSPEIGILAALIGAYHNRIMDIYVSGGTVYDVLCFTFYVAALCVYIRGRSGGGPLSWKTSALFVALNVLALNSKEMAATLPVVLLAYELLYHKKFPRSAALWISFAMTIVATKLRTGAGTAFSGNPEYALHISVRQFFLTTRQLLDDLFVLQPGTLSTAKAAGILLLVWVIAILAKRRDLRLAAVIITLAPLPINFINYRGFFVMYLPMLGWVMFAAIAIVASRDWLLQHVWNRAPLPPRTWEPERVAAFVFTLYVLFNVYAHDPARSFLYPIAEQQHIRELNESLTKLRLPIPKGGSVLFLDNGLEDRWAPLYVLRFYYGDPTMNVDVEPQDRQYDRRLKQCGHEYCEAAR